jgi:hypothetical protein
VRAGVFFVAFVVMMVATFADAVALLARVANPWLAYVPAALVAAALLAHARVAPRLPQDPAWTIVLALLALAQLGAAFVPPAYAGLVRYPLVVAIVLVLLRLKPRVGSLYEATPVPGILAFLSLTALLSQSVAIVKDLAAAGLSHAAIERIPAPMANVAAAAIVVAAFIVASRIRHRTLQPCPAKSWLAAGLLAWIVAAAAAHAHALAEYAAYGLLAAHAMLFVGAAYLLSHLLPRRAADELA